MMKIFVTGADGFIGSTFRKLVLKGYKVKALSMYNSFNSCKLEDHTKSYFEGN